MRMLMLKVSGMQVPIRASSGIDSHCHTQGAGRCGAAAVPEALRGLQIQLQPRESAVQNPHRLTSLCVLTRTCKDELTTHLLYMEHSSLGGM